MSAEDLLWLVGNTQNFGKYQLSAPSTVGHMARPASLQCNRPIVTVRSRTRSFARKKLRISRNNWKNDDQSRNTRVHLTLHTIHRKKNSWYRTENKSEKPAHTSNSEKRGVGWDIGHTTERTNNRGGEPPTTVDAPGRLRGETSREACARGLGWNCYRVVTHQIVYRQSGVYKSSSTPYWHLRGKLLTLITFFPLHQRLPPRKTYGLLKSFLHLLVRHTP